jgi:hypothetical protein
VAAVGARRATPPGPGPALWGLARREALEASHPAFVTRHVTTWKHAPFSTAPRVCLRLGVVQNQRFSGPHGHHLAPSWASSQKNPEKTGKNVLKNGAKWRFFGGLKRHFAVPAADGARSQHANMQYFTSVASGCIEQAAAPEIGSRAPFFTALWVGDHLGARNTRDCWILLKATLMPCAPGWGPKRRSSLTGHPRQLEQLHAPCCPPLAAPPCLSSGERAPEFAVT